MTAPRPAAWHRAKGPKRGPDLYVTTRGPIALIRGAAAVDVIAVLGLDQRWSRSGRGWVIESRHVEDVEAWAQANRLLAITNTHEGHAQ